MLVCPKCGSEDFYQERTARILYTVQIFEAGLEDDVAEEVLDGGDRNEPLCCAGCGFEFEQYDELVTEETRAMTVHEIDDLAQRVLGNLDPGPGESYEAYATRRDRAWAAFEARYPEWKEWRARVDKANRGI